MQSTAIKAYEIFKRHFTAEEAEILMDFRDESLFRWVASKEDIASVRTELAEVRNELATVRTELKEDIAGIREDMLKMEGSLRADMFKMEGSMIKWFIGTALAMTGLLSGIVFALLKLVH